MTLIFRTKIWDISISIKKNSGTYYNFKRNRSSYHKSEYGYAKTRYYLLPFNMLFSFRKEYKYFNYKPE